ncbi:hypothetical protein ASPCADRAFT_210152 [Aspergillus carbonarius ITEM 5010]|uniref:Uncharacterized protein n=1 Tax=Aspergillus carbonarius (strain ITEM 5010) TaxID=602072 RepID=A0A1R3REL0_ASPC5|nr:hypothetical protein ASPCADRAFT_210152 [Aspergillus carbonarius ITEM 5010]
MPPEVGRNTELGTSTEHIPGLVQPSCILRHSVPCNNPLLDDAQQTSSINPKADLLRDSGTREMTLKMTLTRSDLRTNCWITIPPVVDTPGAIEATKSPLSDRDPQPWDSNEEKRSKMKSMWCKLQKLNQT